jgi:hypothetical protein
MVARVWSRDDRGMSNRSLPRFLSGLVMGLVVAVFAFAPPASADWNGDANGDVLAVNGGGQLMMWRGDGIGWWITGQQELIGGAGWGSPSFNLLMAPGDFSGDGKPDILGRTPGGQLVMWRGNGAGLWLNNGAQTLIGGAGWGPPSFDLLMSYGDWSGDGKTDVLGRTPAGQLIMWRGNGAGGWLNGGAQTLVGGAGWQSFDTLLMPGDFSGDGKPDILGRTPAGQLIMWKGNGAGGFLDGGAQTLVGGAGWEAFDKLIAGGDFTGDGKPDIIGRTPAGQLIMWRGNGAGAFLDGGAQTLIGTGFNAFNNLMLVGGSRIVPYPTSERYGGANKAIDTPAELAAVAAALSDGNGSITGEMQGLAPADADRVADYLTTPIGSQHIEGAEEDPTAADMADWPQDDVAEATAASGSKWKCKQEWLESDYSVGRHWFHARWCYNRSRHKVRASGFPTTWFEPKDGWGNLITWDIDHQKAITQDPADHNALILEDQTHLKIYFKYTGRLVGNDYNDLFRIRAYSTGGYRWRVDDLTAAIGPLP